MANAAWLALAVMAPNFGLAVGRVDGSDLKNATAATLRRTVVTMPGRLIYSGDADACDYPSAGRGRRPSSPP
jgi:hypothetical protein